MADPGAIAEGFRATAPGTVVIDRDLIAPHLTDWRGRAHGDAALLLRPGSAEEVSAILRTAAAQGLAVVPQGGRTGLVGGGLPEPGRRSVLLSLERMARIRSVDVPGRTMVSEAGVVLEAVHAAAAAVGLRFPLSLAAKGSATVGGLVSTNAGGVQVLRHGTMRARVLGLEAVLPDGSIWRGLSPLRKDNSGYNLTQLLIGAEGTLGVVTAASLLLAPEPAERAVGWAALPSPEAALDLLGRLGEAAESFELIPEQALVDVLRFFPAERRPLAAAGPWHALIEVTGPAGVADLMASALADADDAVIAHSGAQAAALWRLRELVPEAERHQGPAAKHDIALPVAAVPGFLRDSEAAIIAAFPGARVFAFGHLGDGNLHYNIQPPTGADGAAWLRDHGAAVSELVHDRTVALGGSISAEHGIGAFKRSELLRTADPAKLAAMRAIKAALDPMGLMNPGKIF